MIFLLPNYHAILTLFGMIKTIIETIDIDIT